MNHFAASLVLLVIFSLPNVAFVAGTVAAAESGREAVAASDGLTSKFEVPKWMPPDARSVRIDGPLGDAYRKGVVRLRQDPYRSAAYLRADVSLEMKAAAKRTGCG